MVNKVILVGNVGKDPEVRTLDNGVSVASFSLATSESYKNKAGELVKSTEWHNISVWRGLADVASKYVKKGTQLYVEGKIRTRSYDDKDGNKKYITEIIADNFTMLGRKADGSTDGGAGFAPSSNTASVASQASNIVEEDSFSSESDDLPF